MKHRSIIVRRLRKPYTQRVLCCILTLAIVMTAGVTFTAFATRAGDDFHTEGRTANYKYSDAVAPAPNAVEYDSPITIRKTVAQLTGEGYDSRDFELMLTATGYDWKTVKEKPVNVVFVIDTTSSMSGEDIPTESGGKVKRINATFDAVRAYINALYDTASNDKHEVIDTAIVSFGKSARVHFAADDYAYILDMMSRTGVEETGVEEISMTDNGFNGKITDHFIGNYIVSESDTYPPFGYSNGKADDSMYIYNRSVPIFEGFQSAFTKNTDILFYNDLTSLTNIVNNLSRYSDTNIESGLLMANFLLKNKGNTDDAINLVMLITDGEANSSSTLSMLENHPDLKTAILGDPGANAYYSGADIAPLIPILSDSDPNYYDSLMRNTAALAADSGFVDHLLGSVANPADINFFTGVYHNLDRSEYDSSVSKTGAITMLPNSITSTTPVKVQQLFARHVFWLAEVRTDFYRDGTYTVLAQYEKIFSEYNGSGNGSKNTTNLPYFQKLIPYFFTNGTLMKDHRTLLVDYHEHSGAPANASGSDAAKYFMQSAAETVKSISNDTIIYSTGIGSQILMPDKLRVTASRDDTFFICSNATTANIKNAEELQRQFQALGRITSLEGVQNLSITDLIPRREDTSPIADDDTFTVKTPYDTTVKARLWYYDAEGNVTQTDWVFYNEANVDWVISMTESGTSGSGASGSGAAGSNASDPGTLVSYNFGTLYSESISSIKCSNEYPYKAELRIQIRANDGVVSGASDSVPDIDTNIYASASWQDQTRDYSKLYPIPKVYFRPPVTPVTTPDTRESEPPETEPPETEPPETESQETEPPETEPPETEPPETEAPPTEAPPTSEPPVFYQPGGRDPEIPPLPYVPGNEMVPDGDGFIEFDMDGVPLGRWHYEEIDEDEGMWIFDEFPPPLADYPGDMPQTGIVDSFEYLLLLLGCSVYVLCITVRRLKQSSR